MSLTRLIELWSDAVLYRIDVVRTLRLLSMALTIRASPRPALSGCLAVEGWLEVVAWEV